MQKIMNKISTVFVVLIFLISGLTMASAVATQDNNITSEEVPTKTVTLCRFGPEGITPVETVIELEEGKTISELIFEKCSELAKNDQEIIDFLGESGINLSMVSFVQSRGRGFHVKINIRIPMKKLHEKYPNIPPHYRLLKFPIVYTRYPYFERAKTVVSSALGTESINGTHSVACIGFYGYTGWIGPISFRGFISPVNGFAGFSLITKVTEM